MAGPTNEEQLKQLRDILNNFPQGVGPNLQPIQIPGTQDIGEIRNTPSFRQAISGNTTSLSGNRVIDVPAYIPSKKVELLKNPGTALPTDFGQTFSTKKFKADKINLKKIDSDAFTKFLEDNVNNQDIQSNEINPVDVANAELSQNKLELNALSDFLLADKFSNDQAAASGVPNKSNQAAVIKGEASPINEINLLDKSSLANTVEDRKQKELVGFLDNLTSKNDLSNRSLRANILKSLRSDKIQRSKLKLGQNELSGRLLDSAFNKVIQISDILSKSKLASERSRGNDLKKKVAVIQQAITGGLGTPETKANAIEEFKKLFNGIFGR